MKSARDVCTKPEYHDARAAIAEASSGELQAIADHPDNRHDRGKLVDSIIALADAHPDAFQEALRRVAVNRAMDAHGAGAVLRAMDGLT